MKKVDSRFLWVGMFVLVVFFFVQSAVAQETIQVVDTAGRKVRTPQDPTRIICIGPGALRQICYLGSQGRVVGIENFEKQRPIGRPYLYANPELLNLPVIGPGGPGNINKDPDLEMVLKVRPDVIFATYMKPAKADALQMKLNIPVVVLTYGRLGIFDPQVYPSLRLAGTILKKEKRADDIIAYVEHVQADLKNRTGGLEERQKPTCYIGGVGYRGSHGIESTETQYTPLNWAGANNLASRLSDEKHHFIDKEQLLSWNPDVIFIDGIGLSLVIQDYNKNNAFYQGLKAFKTKRVYVVFPFNYYATNIGTAIAGAYAVGKILYPDVFEDIDIKKKADEIYMFLLNRPVYKFMEKDFTELGVVAPFW
ncbi:MAG: iron ABC transporter substrate-binding protein [Deltaproteobacteria bacterium]|nr:iron ABC transporter substrate-binding protein [Deltaproteobacteria bacterium]